MSVPERRGGTSMLRRWDPFRELDDFRERMSRMLEQTFGGAPGLVREGGFTPLVDIEETDDALVFEADLPGVKPEDVSVEVEDGDLRVSGEVRARERSGVVRRQSRLTGSFEFRSTLPSGVDPERIEAMLKDGVLTVRVPKSERAQPRRIEIKTG